MPTIWITPCPAEQADEVARLFRHIYGVSPEWNEHRACPNCHYQWSKSQWLQLSREERKLCVHCHQGRPEPVFTHQEVLADILRDIHNPHGVVLIAHNGQKAIGFTTGRRRTSQEIIRVRQPKSGRAIRQHFGDMPIFYQGELAVLPVYQGLGIGRALHAARLSLALAHSPDTEPQLAGIFNTNPHTGTYRMEMEYGYRVFYRYRLNIRNTVANRVLMGRLLKEPDLLEHPRLAPLLNQVKDGQLVFTVKDLPRRT